MNGITAQLYDFDSTASAPPGRDRPTIPSALHWHDKIERIFFFTCH